MNKTDTLNIIGILDKEFKNFFKPLSPKNMIISINDGAFDNQMCPQRDMVLGIHSLLNF